MSAFWRHFLFLVWLSYLLSCGLLLFSRGFLLSRQVLKEEASCSVLCNKVVGSLVPQQLNNSCISEDAYPLYGSESENICIENKLKVILLVIDALRYDFMVYNSSLKDSEQLAFQNRIKSVNELLLEKPKNAKLYKFVADPPTTTLQRLLGLTTGSLPTFIDAGSNFASTEVNEDNVIDQLVQRNKRAVMMGDDTWIRLYPSKFTREYPYESFNVWDLDTLDNGVNKHLIPEVRKKDWSLLVAHFLGVDHCGHRYGPYHEEMKRKLIEMDDVISKVVNVMDSRTVLFVIGDHGMTATGDHGGASKDEVTAALFAYSNREFYASEFKRDSVSQVDLVPTLASILGIPIPFSNLGALIPDLLPIQPAGNTEQFALRAAWSNVKQISTYVDVYTQKNNDLSQDAIKQIKTEYEDLIRRFKSGSEKALSLMKGAHEYTQSIRAHFVKIWAKFDEFAMTWGLVMFILALFMAFLIVEGLYGDLFTRALSPSYLMFVYSGLILSPVVSWIVSQRQSILSFDILLYLTSCAFSLFCLMLLFIKHKADVYVGLILGRLSQAWEDIIRRKIFIVTLLAMASNSYVVEESNVTFFVLSSLVFLLVFSYKLPAVERRSGTINSMRGRNVERAKLAWLKSQIRPTRAKHLGIALLFSVVLRVSQVFIGCREEQSWCQRALNISDDGEPSPHEYLCLKMLLCIALWVTTSRIWMRTCGNLTGYSMSVLLVRYVPTVVAVCSGGFWVLQGMPGDAKSQLVRPWQVQLLPVTVYILISITVIGLILSPLCVYAVPVRRRRSSITVYAHENAIPQLYNQVKKLLKGDRSKSDSKKSNNRPPGEEKPIVYGLATAYSAAFIVIGVLFVLLHALLLGTNLSPSAVLMGTCGAFLLGLLASLRYENVVFRAQLAFVPWSHIVCWMFLAHYFYYGTGHQATFPSIKWDAAMVGTGGNFAGRHFVPGLLVIINTFGSYMFAALMLPLLMIVPLTVRVMISCITRTALDEGEMTMGELTLFQNDFLRNRSLISLCMRYILLLGLRVLACMISATIHTRHLMTWKVFAPKLIFEGLSFLVALPFIAFAFLFVGRITSSIQSLLIRLDSHTAQIQKA